MNHYAIAGDPIYIYWFPLTHSAGLSRMDLILAVNESHPIINYDNKLIIIWTFTMCEAMS